MEKHICHDQDPAFIMWAMGVGEREREGVLQGFCRWSLLQRKLLPVLERLNEIKSFADAMSVTLRKRGNDKEVRIKQQIYIWRER